MGNRGILHDENNRIVKRWAHKAWVTCLLCYKEIKRPRPFSQGNYSELFFLDEATAFSAGHRPCWFCQRERYQQFKDAWSRTNIANPERSFMNMPEIDKALHKERAIRGGGKCTFDAKPIDLPVGAMFEYEARAFLVTSHGYLPWSFEGYGEPRNVDSTSLVKVLTPESIVRTFVTGFTPHAHLSADR